MWTLLLLSTGCLFARSCLCEKLSGELRSEVQAAVKEMLEIYGITNEQLQSEVTQLRVVVMNQQAKIHDLERRINDMSENDANVPASVTLDGESSPSFKTSDSYVVTKDTKVTRESKTGNVLRTENKRGTRKSSFDMTDAFHSLRPDAAEFNKRHISGNVAFCAYLDHELTHLVQGQVIKYNRFILNDGSAYNTHTGIFTAPITGVYLFMYHYASFSGKTEIRIVIDDVNVVGSVIDHTDQRQYQLMGGNSAIARVTRGQSVWTEPYYVDDQEVDSQSNYRKTTFSGTLLYSTE